MNRHFKRLLALLPVAISLSNAQAIDERILPIKQRLMHEYFQRHPQSSPISDLSVVTRQAEFQKDQQLMESFGEPGNVVPKVIKSLPHQPSDHVWKSQQSSQIMQPSRTTMNDSLQPEWAATFGAGIMPSDDIASAVDHDPNGNIYVAGYRVSGMGDNYWLRDVILIKYDSTGVQQWITHDALDSIEILTAMSIDHGGNILLAGVGLYNNGRLRVIKFNSSGARQWATDYNGPPDRSNFPSYDYPTALATDDVGNIYVTGYSANHMVTLKYDSDGIEQWHRAYASDTLAQDFATDIAVDGSGNVYITGWLKGYSQVNQQMYYGVIKYSSIGSRLWVAKYQKTGSAGYDDPSLALDPSGNVYVVGADYSKATQEDLVTIKYNTAGTQQWAVKYNSPSSGADHPAAITVDALGQVYVTGYSFNNTSYYDFVTIKYSAGGSRLWAAKYDGTGHDADIPTSIKLDSEGSVYVAGTSLGLGTENDFAAVKYDNNGAEQWVSRYNGPANSSDAVSGITVVSPGKLFLAGTLLDRLGAGVISTIGLDAQGAQISRADLQHEETLTPTAYAMYTINSKTVDDSGNCYVTGWGAFRHSHTYTDFVTVKFDPNGIQQWVARYDGPANYEDTPAAIAVDKQGNVYVTGKSSGLHSMFDYATVKYDKNGVQQWAARFDGGSLYDIPEAIALDPSGNVVVTGSGMGSDTSVQFATIEYSPDGNELWRSLYKISPTPHYGGSRATALCIDPAGSVYVAGEDYAAPLPPRITTVKYGHDGSRQWITSYVGATGSLGIGLDLAGNVYVGGWFSTSANWSPGVIKYGADGTLQWKSSFYNPFAGWTTSKNSFAVDGTGNTYIVEQENGSTGYFDFSVLKFPSNGGGPWVRHRNRFIPGGIAADPFGNVLISGTYYNVKSPDYGTFVYDPDGNEALVALYDFNNNSEDWGAGLSVDSAGNFYVVGGRGVIRYSSLAPKAVLSATSMAFDTLNISCLDSKEMTIQNSGKSNLQISSAVSGNPNFVLEPTMATIAPANSGVFKVSFSPSTTGAMNSTIVFTTNTAKGTDSVSVVGLGINQNSDLVIQNSMGKGWQMVSLPVNLTGCSPQISNLFVYDARYLPSVNLVPGNGYWSKLKFDDVAFVGTPVNALTSDVAARWDLIGSISTPVPTSAVVTSPADNVQSQFYGYSPTTGYAPAATIEPGKAYWVKMKQAGQLTLSAASSAEPKIAAAVDPLQSANVMTFTDARNRTQQLYFARYGHDQDMQAFEMPPAAPNDMFDARYSSGRILELIEGNSSDQYPIVFSGASYPMTVRWRISGTNSSAALKVGSNTIPLSHSSEIRIDAEMPIRLVSMNVLSVPKEFALMQNYPNPFNPLTVIEYALPAAGYVTLKVFNLLGQEVRTLIDGQEEAGARTIRFDATSLPSGVYTYRLTSGAHSEVKTMVLVK